MVLYNLEKNSVKWVKRISSTMGNFHQYNDVLIFSNGNLTNRMNMETGKKRWQNTNQTYYIDPYAEIGIGYPYFNAQGMKRIEAIDLKTGRNIWYRDNISGEYGWSDLFPISDSSIMLVAAGIHTINLYSGIGWDYNAITGSNDYTTTILANTAGVLIGALTGYYTIYDGHDVVTDVVSNVCFDEQNQIYFASKDKLACLDGYNGNVFWSHEFEKRTTSKSSLFIRDSLVYMINFGYAYMNGNPKDFGRPFIAAFNRFTGSQYFFTEVSSKEARILDFLVSENEIAVLFKDRISSYSVHDGHLLKDKTLNTIATGNPISFCGDMYYLPYDSVYLSLSANNPYNLYILNHKSQILTLDNEFQVSNTSSANQYYISYLEGNEIRFLGRSNETIITDPENIKIATIQASPQAFLMGNKLYDIQGNALLEIDLNEFLNAVNQNAEKKETCEE
jgi:hypothetical protein